MRDPFEYDFSKLPLTRGYKTDVINRSPNLDDSRKLDAENTVSLMLKLTELVRSARGIVCESGYDDKHIFLHYVTPSWIGFQGALARNMKTAAKKYGVHVTSLTIGSSTKSKIVELSEAIAPKAPIFEEVVNVPKEVERKWQADTLVGNFFYGVDSQGNAFWGQSGYGRRPYGIKSLEDARTSAIKAYRAAVMSHPVVQMLNMGD